MYVIFDVVFEGVYMQVTHEDKAVRFLIPRDSGPESPSHTMEIETLRMYLDQCEERLTTGDDV